MEEQTEIDPQEDSSDIDLDEYKDIPIELVDSSKKRFLQWEAFDD